MTKRKYATRAEADADTRPHGLGDWLFIALMVLWILGIIGYLYLALLYL